MTPSQISGRGIPLGAVHGAKGCFMPKMDHRGTKGGRGCYAQTFTKTNGRHPIPGVWPTPTATLLRGDGEMTKRKLSKAVWIGQGDALDNLLQAANAYISDNGGKGV